jgi:hypothetical protein
MPLLHPDAAAALLCCCSTVFAAVWSMHVAGIAFKGYTFGADGAQATLSDFMPHCTL